MEHMRFELTTSTMRMWRAPNCANAPLCETIVYNKPSSNDFQVIFLILSIDISHK